MTPTPPPKHRLLQRLGLALAATLASLVVAEVGLRVAGFEFRLYPERIEFGWPDPETMEDRFTPHGRFLWVRKDYDERLARAKKRPPYLALLGCSCTARGKFGAALARRVRSGPGAPPFPIANLACSGWSTYQGLQQMKTDVLAVNPEVVTIFFGWNDHWEGFGVDDKRAAELTSAPLLLTFQRLRIAQLVSKALLSRQVRAEKLDLIGARPMRVSLPDFQTNLEEMIATARANDIVPVLITAPTSHKRGEEPEHLKARVIADLSKLVPLHQEYVAVVRQVAEEQGVLLFDLADAFAKLPREELLTYMMKDGIHFTTQGGMKVGELLHRCLAENGLLPAKEG